MRTRSSNQIVRYDGKNCFIEAISNAFDIDKLQMNFVEYDGTTNKQTKKISIYLDIDKALALCESIVNGQLATTIKEAKSKSTFSPYASYFTDLGGIPDDKVSAKFESIKAMYPFIEKNQSLSRQFKVQAGMKLPWVLRAEAGIGNKIETGIIVPQGKPEMVVNIPLTDEQMLGFAMVIKAHYQAYLNQFYAAHGSEMFENKLTLFEGGKSNN